MKFFTQRDDLEPYQTKDGSEIREMLHPDRHAVKQQSLAEASIPPACQTQLHCHHVTEEIYHILQGKGEMTLGEQRFPVKPGDSILILPGTAHRIENTGNESLRILCCCAPAYSHDDTELLQMK